jgi:hypothetical protein
MRYLKYFESKENTPLEELNQDFEDIVKVLTKYYKTHNDHICSEIEEIIWNTSAGDELDETGVVTEDLMRQALEDYKSASNRDITKLLDTYYDCYIYVKNLNEDLTESIEEIFYEYTDSVNDHRISKTSHEHDDRYTIYIPKKNILLNINFNEIIKRMEDLGFIDYLVKASNEHISIEFWRKLPDLDEE